MGIVVFNWELLRERKVLLRVDHCVLTACDGSERQQHHRLNPFPVAASSQCDAALL